MFERRLLIPAWTMFTERLAGDRRIAARFEYYLIYTYLKKFCCSGCRAAFCERGR
jgi:hypothetical protein